MEKFLEMIPENKRHIIKKMKEEQEKFLGGGIGVTKSNGKSYPPGFLAETAKFAKEEWEGIRKNDVFIASFPKTGTNWLGEVVSNIVHSPVELALIPHIPMPLMSVEVGPAIKFEVQDALPLSRRVMISHLDGEDFPIEKATNKGAKIIYILRNPKDQTVSWFHFANKVPPLVKSGLISKEWKQFTQDYFTGKHPLAVRDGDWYPEHILSWYKHKDQPNIKFIFYEDMKKDLPLEVRKLAEFLEVKLNDEEVNKVAEACTFDAMKKKVESIDKDKKALGIMRKGGVGGWKDYFTVAQSEAIDAECDDKFSNTDIKFTYQL